MPETVKAYRRGGHRLVPPTATLERLGHLLTVVGITRVADVTGLDHIGLPVIMVCRPDSRCLAVAQGKGVDATAAKVSGLMESIESYHAESILRPLKLASNNELRLGHTVVDVARLPRVDVHAFHDDLRTLWIESRDLARGRSVWLPYELVHLDFTIPLPAGSGCFPMGSNGLASGNHDLEAVCHGICEVVERDAFALWRCSGERARQRSRLDLSSVDDPICCQVLDRYFAADMTVAVWDITSDVGIPAFRCHICDSEPNLWRPLPVAAGMGCHPSRGIALIRALTEAAQSRLTAISGSRDDLSRHDAKAILQAHEELLTELGVSSIRRSFLDLPTYESDTFESDLDWLSGRLAAAGFPQILVVDLTRPDLELPVVRVVIPGLEGHSETLAYRPGPRLKAHLQHLAPGTTTS